METTVHSTPTNNTISEEEEEEGESSKSNSGNTENKNTGATVSDLYFYVVLKNPQHMFMTPFQISNGTLTSSIVVARSFPERWSELEFPIVFLQNSFETNSLTRLAWCASVSFQASNEKFTWRINLSKTEKYWEGWFSKLSSLFLSCEVPKMLLLAGVDRLDKELTIGQMQGKVFFCFIFSLAKLHIAVVST